MSARPRGKAGWRAATHWTCTGSWVSGKNVPLNRKSGLITKRKIQAKPASLRWVAAKLMIAALKATPVSTAAGIASTASRERGMANSHSTPRKTVEISTIRKPIQASSPPTMWRTLRGVASIAS